MEDRLFVSRSTEYCATQNSDARLSQYNIFNPNFSEVNRQTKNSRKHGKKQKYYDPKIKPKASKSIKASTWKANNGRSNSKWSYRTMVNSFFQQSSVYALNQVGNSVTARRKVFWTLILIFGVAGCLAQVGQFFTAYFKYPVVVNRDSISPEYQEFPAVTICNLNAVRNEFASCLETDSNNYLCLVNSESPERKKSLENLSETICPEAPFLLSNTTEKEVLWLRKLMSLDSASREAYGHQAKDFIRFCKFSTYTCNYENFKLSDSLSSGNCYIFNSARYENYLRLFNSGPFTGLELELDLEVNKYTEHTDSVGAVFQIHSPFLDHDIENERIHISPGFKHFVGLSTYASVRQPPPYKDHCREYALNESRMLCRHQCLNNLSFSICSCALWDKITHRGSRICDWNNAKDLCCMYQVNQMDLDVCDCPLPCRETRYQMRISRSEWPTKAYYEDNKINFAQKADDSSTILPLEEVRKTRLKLMVFFDTLDYTVYQQNPMYHSSEVLSQIGSQMGLWLGLSLVAIFECIENIIALFRYRMNDG